MATEQTNQWSLGTFEMKGVMVPVALMLAGFKEACTQFEIDIDEMEDELAKFREKNPAKEYIAIKKEARINRLCNMRNSYELMLGYYQDQIKQLQRLNAEMRAPYRDTFIEHTNGGYHSVKTLLRQKFKG